MIILKIDKITLDGYRDYKIDLTEDKVEENYTYNVMEHMLKDGWKMQKFYDVLGDNEWVMVDVETGDIIDSKKTLTSNELGELMKELNKNKPGYKIRPNYTIPDKNDDPDWSKVKPKKDTGSPDNPYDIKF